MLHEGPEEMGLKWGTSILFHLDNVRPRFVDRGAYSNLGIIPTSARRPDTNFSFFLYILESCSFTLSTTGMAGRSHDAIAAPNSCH